MKLIPESLVGRALAVLLVGLAVSHVISLTIYATDRYSVSASAAGRRVAEHIAGATAAVQAAPPDARPAVVRSYWGPGFRVSLTAESVLPPGIDGWRARQVRRALDDYLGGIADDRIRVAYRGGATPGAWFRPGETDERWRGLMGHMMSNMDNMMGGMGGMMGRGSGPGGFIAHMWAGGEVLEVSLRLADGAWLNFAAPPVTVSPFWRSPYFLSILATTLVVIGLSVWALRRATAPLETLAEAAARLGRDVNAPPLEVVGPGEVRRAAGAFNEMQRRIRSFIADRTQMLAAISHDLRTPITRLRLRAEFVDDKEAQEKILADLDEMEAMIAATLAFASDDAADVPTAVFDIAGLLRGLADDAADGGAKASYAGPGTFSFNGRPGALKRLFANLVENAVKYGGGATVTLAGDENRATVSVADDGPGIPEAELERVFQPFYRLDRSRNRETGGTGLGLAVVRSIARAHGGDVTLASRPEGGLVATVTLPKA